MALVDSLLTAMVRANGDALVMHVGERPIVVAGLRTIDLSTHGMNLGAMVGMLGQLLSGDALATLKEFGAVEHELPERGTDQFSVVAARSGEDIWIEIRRRRESEAPVPVAVSDPAPVAAAEAVEEPSPSAIAPESHPRDEAAFEVHANAPELVEPAPADAQAEVEAESEAAAAAEDAAPQEDAAPEPAISSLPEASEPEAMPELHPAVEEAAAGPHQEIAEETGAAEIRAETDEAPAPEPMVARAEPPPPVETEVDQVAEIAPSFVEAPPQPVLASAGTPEYPTSTLAPLTPMEARHPVPPAGGSPPRSSDAEPPHAGAGETATGANRPDAPVTRTVRIEVPSRSAPSRAAGIDRLLRAADSTGASELFLVSQARPYVRVAGNVRALQDEAVLVAADIETLIADVTPEPWRDAVRRGDPAEWLIELADVGRVRCSTFRDHRGPGANFHFAFLRVVTSDDLQLSPETRLLATEPDGLILVAGMPGSDASAIVAAFVDILNQQRADYIVTLEPQVRVLHINRQALISQREVGLEPGRAAASLRAALREQPDVLVIEGLASSEMAQLAIDAASQERLVIASLEAPTAAAAMQRLIELVPADQRAAARASLSRCFRGAVAQLLLRKATGGRIAARELLTGTRSVSRLLAEGDLARLAGAHPDGLTGAAPLGQSIVQFVRSGVVDVREALRKAPDADALVAALEAAGVDLGAVKGWN